MNWKQKLSSRKLWAALAGVAVGLVVAFGGEAETIKTVAGSVMSVVSAIIYILAEAGVDKAAAGSPDIHILPDVTEGKGDA
nr:MAG TPA: holin [Caudoviricetes sp.]